MKRKIVKIDEDLCNGCGACIPNCHEGALQIIDGKARLVSDIFCDGLGACIGHCPLGAISMEETEAEPYNEIKVMEKIIPQGMNTIKAHINHLMEHNETELVAQALNFLKEKNINIEMDNTPKMKEHKGCCGSMPMNIDINKNESPKSQCGCKAETELKQWPVQLHLINPNAGYFNNAEVLLAADCCAFAFGDFHNKFIKGNIVAIACPKLDSNKQNYIEKITQMIDNSNIKSLHVVIMEVPCCSGLLQLVKIASENASKKIPIYTSIVGINGSLKVDKVLNYF